MYAPQASFACKRDISMIEPWFEIVFKIKEKAGENIVSKKETAPHLNSNPFQDVKIHH